MSDEATVQTVDPFDDAIPVGDPSAKKLSAEVEESRVLPEEKPEPEAPEEKPEPEVETPEPEVETEEKPEDAADEVRKLRTQLESTQQFARNQQALRDAAEYALKQITPAQEKTYREQLEAQYPIINDEEVFQARVDDKGWFKAQKEREAAQEAVRESLEEAREFVQARASLEVRKQQASDDAISYGKSKGLSDEQVRKMFKVYGYWAGETPENALESAKAAIDFHAPSIVNTQTAESVARATETKIRKKLAKTVPGGGLGAGSQPEDSGDSRIRYINELASRFAPDVEDPFAR